MDLDLLKGPMVGKTVRVEKGICLQIPCATPPALAHPPQTIVMTSAPQTIVTFFAFVALGWTRHLLSWFSRDFNRDWVLETQSLGTELENVLLYCCTDSKPCTLDAKEPRFALHAEEHRKHAWCDAYVLDLPIFVLVVYEICNMLRCWMDLYGPALDSHWIRIDFTMNNVVFTMI